MLPEEKVARRFSELKGISPPVNVEDLVVESAELEEDSLPAGYDAVFLDKSTRYPRARVIIEANLPASRRTFTLAHEMGHLVIPWHNGTHFCRVDGDLRLVDDLTREVESQANRFAAELLMPSSWIMNLVGSVSELRELVEAVKSSGVSYHAASIRLIQLLPTGFLFVETDSDQNVVRAACSQDTWISRPQMGARFQRKEFDEVAEQSAIFKNGGSRLLWWKLAGNLKPPAVRRSAESSSELLRRICLEEFGDTQAAKTAIMRIHGVIGAANGSASAQHGGDFFTVLKRRFLVREGLSTVVRHESFDTFLAMRVRELRGRGL